MKLIILGLFLMSFTSSSFTGEASYKLSLRSNDMSATKVCSTLRRMPPDPLLRPTNLMKLRKV